MKTMKRKLKLTKLTIADLDRVRGGEHLCACLITDDANAYRNENMTRFVSLCPPICVIEI